MIIKNPFNYTASKDRILDIIKDNLDYDKKIFLDMFCGSGVVSVNVANNYDRVILNDGCWQVIKLLEAIYEDDEFIAKVEKVIDQFGLSKVNKEAYIDARSYYNSYLKNMDNFNPYFLYALMSHAFNYQLVFNKSDGFSVPSGKNRSSFNNSLRTKLHVFQKYMKDLELEFYSFKLEEMVNLIKDTFVKEDYEELMIYCDPPYSRCCSDGSINRSYGLKWGETEDRILLNFLDFLNEQGASFMLSNVLENNGKENKLVKDWAKKYEVIPISLGYNNCFYTRKNAGETKEVIVRNY